MVADRYLRFDVRRPPNGRPLLWPVRVWKVLYPTNRVLKLNLFQQAILGLARARCQDSSEMAELRGAGPRTCGIHHCNPTDPERLDDPPRDQSPLKVSVS